MTFRRDVRSDDITRYLSRAPERLVLEGYRTWTSGVRDQAQVPIQSLVQLYVEALGPDNGRTVLCAFHHFIQTTGLCARCPLRMLETECNALCRDEALILGLVAGLQHGDQSGVTLCLGELACPARVQLLACSAGTFAFLLRGLGQTLLPIPCAVLSAILGSVSAEDLPDPLHMPPAHFTLQ